MVKPPFDWQGWPILTLSKEMLGLLETRRIKLRTQMTFIFICLQLGLVGYCGLCCDKWRIGRDRGSDLEGWWMRIGSDGNLRSVMGLVEVVDWVLGRQFDFAVKRGYY